MVRFRCVEWPIAAKIEIVAKPKEPKIKPTPNCAQVRENLKSQWVHAIAMGHGVVLFLIAREKQSLHFSGGPYVDAELGKILARLHLFVKSFCDNTAIWAVDRAGVLQFRC